MGKFEQEAEALKCSLAAAPFKVERENSNKKLAKKKLILASLRVEVFEKV